MKNTILAALLLASLPAGARPAPEKPKEKRMLDASFECSVPAGWNQGREEGALRLTGPADSHDVVSLIVVRYYAPGSKEFPSLEAFLARQTAPSPFASAQAPGPVKDAVVAGRKAKRFEASASEFVPPASMNGVEVPMREDTVAVPAAKGFYVLRYYAPKSLDKKGRAAFSAVLKSFKPAL